MKPEEIKFGDWGRILFGEVPWDFFIELIIRCCFIYLLLLISMRLLGKRMSAQLNRIEMIALFSLAAAIGVPLQAPDRGILPAVVIALVVVLVGKLVATLGFKGQRFESLSEDKFNIVVKDGVFQLKKMKQTRLTIERVYAELRGEGIRQLGEVKRLYFEANGSFSIIKEEKPAPGLPLIPIYDRAFLKEQEQTNIRVCRTCGTRQPEQKPPQDKCPQCGDDRWMTAIK